MTLVMMTAPLTSSWLLLLLLLLFRAHATVPADYVMTTRKTTTKISLLKAIRHYVSAAVDIVGGERPSSPL